MVCAGKLLLRSVLLAVHDAGGWAPSSRRCENVRRDGALLIITVPYNTYDSWYKSISGNIRSLARGSAFTSYQVADTVAPGLWDGLTVCNTNIKKKSRCQQAPENLVCWWCADTPGGAFCTGELGVLSGAVRCAVASSRSEEERLLVCVVVPAIPPEAGWLDCHARVVAVHAYSSKIQCCVHHLISMFN
jgi:hypothetical protein